MTKLFKSKPLIIAEVGSNFSCFNDAKDAIAFAERAGADAVKFQLHSHQALYGYGPSETNMPLDWFPKLKEKAVACGIEFMCSAFSPELYRFVDPYVEVHKVASSELTDPYTLRAVGAFKKPVILSTGASALNDVKQAALCLKDAGAESVTLLYCSSAYPSRYYDLFMLDDLKELGYPVGLSDHSLAVYYPAISAVRHFGAVVIEKHVNFVPGLDSADSGHSLSSDEFKFMCDKIRGVRDSKFNPQPEERDMFLLHNRRLVATQDIKAGGAFEFGFNFGPYRVKKHDVAGLAPFYAGEVGLTSATRDIKQGESIGPSDLLTPLR